jgi:hypothetical protein
MATFFANVYATGRLVISDHPDAMCIAEGPEKALRNHFGVVCRHAYKRGVLLVPGIPEAKNETKGLQALRAFVKWTTGCTASTAHVIGTGARKPHARTVPANVRYRPATHWDATKEANRRAVT